MLEFDGIPFIPRPTFFFYLKRLMNLTETGFLQIQRIWRSNGVCAKHPRYVKFQHTAGPITNP